MAKFSVGQVVWACDGVGRDLKVFQMTITAIREEKNYTFYDVANDSCGWEERLLFSTEKEAIDDTLSAHDLMNRRMLNNIDELKYAVTNAKKEFRAHQATMKRLKKRSEKLLE